MHSFRKRNLENIEHTKKETFKEFFQIKLDDLGPPTVESQNRGTPYHHTAYEWDNCLL